MKRLGSLLAMTVLIAACSTTPPTPAPAAPAAPEAKAYATLGKLMRGIPFPASNIIFDAGTNDPAAPPKAEGAAGAGGATAQYGNIYGGWEQVENAALAISETANLIMIPGRTCLNGKPVPVEADDFKKWAADLATAGEAALKAAQSKNIDAMIEVGGTVSDACAACHDKYRETADGDIKGRC